MRSKYSSTNQKSFPSFTNTKASGTSRRDSNKNNFELFSYAFSRTKLNEKCIYFDQFLRNNCNNTVAGSIRVEL
jgi:hypothetical protein